MGIYIKNMEMPKDDQKIRFIKLLNGKTYAVKETRNGLPLSYLNEVIEVTKPHGPLIDEDTLRENFNRHLVGIGDGRMLDAFDDTLTVIEAEGK